jgi:hypothetical protein
MLLFSGCYQTENGLVFGKPGYEKRSIAVTLVDLNILQAVDDLLSNEDSWSKDGDRVCHTQEKYSLFCALEKASIEVNGQYIHRKAALQEVRFAIDDYYRNYWRVHRLSDFNSNPQTRFSDIKRVIAVAINNVKRKLEE